jgi:hypothetical protein
LTGSSGFQPLAPVLPHCPGKHGGKTEADMIACLDLRGLRALADLGLDRVLVWLAVVLLVGGSALAGLWLEQAMIAPLRDWPGF